MTVLEQSRSSLDSYRERCDMTDMVLSIAGSAEGHSRVSTDARMDRVNALRRAIAEERYFVSSADLATKLMGAMQRTPTLRNDEGLGRSRTAPMWGGVRYHGIAHATFPARQASESAEDRNDERVGKVDRIRRT
jgi:anti-sigma28 factor (negative regulator of flagellin synthesis)